MLIVKTCYCQIPERALRNKRISQKVISLQIVAQHIPHPADSVNQARFSFCFQFLA